METVDWRPRKLRFQQREKSLGGRVLLVTAVIRPGKKFRPNFLRSRSLLYKILPTNLGACKPTFYVIYTSHLRWNSTMKHCFYHTDLGQQNAEFHKFAIQIAIIQYSGRSKHAWALAKPLKKFPKSPIRPAGSDFCSASCGECLNEH